MTIRVLFVDDEPRVLESLRVALRRSDLEIQTASSGEDALAFLASQDVDVVVSDERMPGTQGSELLAQVYEAMPATIRILLTGQATVEAATRAVNTAHVHRFLTKPTSPADLLATIRSLVHERDGKAATAAQSAAAAPARDRAMATLEAEHPGIGRVARDRRGRIVIDG